MKKFEDAHVISTSAAASLHRGLAPRRSFSSRLLSAGKKSLAIALSASMALSLGVLGAAGAGADTAPLDPGDPATPETVSADSLPTVQIDGVAWRQLVVGNTVYVVGSFNTARPAGSAPGANTVTRNNILAYDIRNGNLISSFAPSLNGQATAIAASPDGTRIYVGGQFTAVNGATVWRVAALDATTGALITSFLPKMAATVYSIVATNTTVYMGGLFKSVGSVDRGQLAAFNAADGTMLDWAPQAVGGRVNAMVLSPDGSQMVVGGQFTTLNGSNRPGYGLGAVDTASGALLPFAANNLIRNAGSEASILSLATDGEQIYGSGFVFGNGGNLEGIFAANWSDGAVKWVNDCHGDTYDIYPGAGAVYAAGHSHYCGNIGGFPQEDPWEFHRGLAMTKAVTGTVTKDPHGYFNFAGNPRPSLLNWYPDLDTGTVTGQNQGPWAVTGNNDYVVMGGEFRNVNNSAQQGLVRFAKKNIAPNLQGPRLTGSRINPSVVSMAAGTVRIGWQSNWDRDNENLSYEVIRDGNIAVPIYTVDQTSTFWNRPAMGFVDTGLVPGSEHRYRLFVHDPFNNEVRSETVYVTVADAGSASAYGAKVVEDGAAKYWRLGEASGTTGLDWAGWSDLTVGSGVTRGAPGAIPDDLNTSTTFDGTANGVAATATSVLAPNTFSAEMWINTTTNRGGKILGYGNAATGLSGSYDRQVYMDNNGRIVFGVYTGNSQTISSTGTYNDGGWHHIVASLGAGGMSLYVDGVRVAANPSVTAGQDYSGYWRVGGDNLSSWPSRPTSNYFAGAIDEVAIYDTNLTRAQLQSHYLLGGGTLDIPTDAYGKAVYENEPVLFWRLGEATGNTAADSGPSAHPGTYNNGVTKGLPGALTGQSNTAAQFDGTSGLVASSDQFNNPTTYSEELWFKTTTTNGGKLIGFGASRTGLSNNYDRHVYMETDGRLTFGTYTGATNMATTTSAYNDGGWHHMVATQGADGMKLYVDGTVRATNPATGAENYNGYWRVGSDTTWGPQPYFAGIIDEVAVYPVAVSAADIANHFALGGTGEPANAIPTAAFTSTVAALSASFDASASTDSDGTVASYDWDFGDSTPHGSGATAEHTYESPGTYQVVLTVTDNRAGTGTVTHPVTVVAANVVPTAAFTHTVDELKASFNGSTSADSDGTLASYDWDFGDFTPHGSGATLDHTYSAAGTYQVTLTVTDNESGTGSVTMPVEVVAPNVAPVAAFTSSVAALAASFDASTSADSDGTVDSYDWDFGDSTPHGSGATANHTYATPGSYDVVLTVTDDDGATGTVTHTVTVAAANVGPTAAFTSSAAGLVASFNGSDSTDSDGTVASYSWDFGDSTAPGSGATPNHSYVAAGTYTVVLTVTDDDGATGTVTHVLTVALANVAPVAAFTASSSALLASFDALASTDSDGTVDSYSWDFGDFSPKGSGATIDHSYMLAGTYQVTLTVTDDHGSTGTLTQTVSVSTLPNVAPVAAFTSTVNALTASFDGTGSSDGGGTIESYAWDFGDFTTPGTTATLDHTYALAGTYQVTLTVTDNNGSATAVTHPVTVVGGGDPDPDPGVLARDGFGRTVTNGLGSADVGGAWSLNGSASGFSVSGGSGSILSTRAGSGPGAYLSSLSSNSTDTVVQFSMDKIANGGGSYVYVAGRSVPGGGDYQTKVRVASDGTLTLYSTAVVGGVLTTLRTANITGFKLAANQAMMLRTQVVGTSPTTIQAKLWRASDTEPVAWQVTGTDTTAALQAPGSVGLLTYVAGSSTNVPVTFKFDNLLVTGPGGTPPANVAPVAAFTSSAAALVGSFNGSGSADSDGTVASYAWDFGDSSASGSGATPNHTYALAGTYTVVLTVTDNLGATATVSHPITVTSVPVPNVAPVAAFTSSAAALVASFNGSGSTDSDGTVASYAWDFGDSSAAGSGATPNHTYALAGTYTVVLTVTDNLGATNTVSHPITVVAGGVPDPGVLVQDDFGRTVTNGLGIADEGGAWSLNGSASGFSVSGGTGAILSTRAGSGPGAYLNQVSSSSTDTLVQFSMDKIANGGGSYVYVSGRSVPGAGEYRSKVKVAADGTLTLYSTAVVGGVLTTLRTANIPGFKLAANQAMMLRTQVVGTSPTTIQAKLWRASESEPAAWQVTGTDTRAVLQAPGSVGLLTYVSGSSTNVPVTFKFDNLLVTGAGGTPPANVAPVAAFTSSAAALVASFNGSGSTDSDGTVASYAWDFGDSSAPGSGATPNHTYMAAGSYTVVLTVTDNLGATATVSHPITVTSVPVPNVAPVAAFTSSSAELAASFNGSGSTDSDGTVASYAWDFGDASAPGSGATPNHTYAAAGTYTVVLTVTDNLGATATVSHPITVVAGGVPDPGVLVQDDFGRTVTNGLGSADVGGAWSLNGSASGFSVSGGTGAILSTRAGSGPGAYLNQVSSSSTDTLVSFSMNKIANGGGSYVYVSGRSVPGAGEYRAKVKVAADGTLTLYSTAVVGGVLTTLRTANIPGFKLAADQVMMVRLEVVGTGSTTIRAKLWRATDTEPTAWQVTGTDTTAALQAPGSVGLLTYVSASSTNVPVIFKFGDFLVKNGD